MKGASAQRAKRVMGVGIMMTAAAIYGEEICTDTSEDVRDSCRQQARADFYLESAKCENIMDAEARRACKQEARAARMEQLEDCDDQFEARKDLCEVLGADAYDPGIDPSDFVAGVDNPYFPLTPGTTYVYEQHDDEGVEHQELTVTHDTRVILGVTCIQVHDVVALNGVVIEDTLDWYAQDARGNVWYFGEIAMNFDDGWLTDVDGSWIGGVHRAKPGIIMQADAQTGNVYRQEFDLGNAEDVAGVLSLIESVDVPYAHFDGCMLTEDYTPIEPDAREHKFYASGIGQVLTINLQTGARLELIDIR
ncbi:MAG: hypothetical protein IT449_18425 [Phycisphaerales bacterium]|nr:hypothetical protein [Phycisphaerales bacterium]